MGAHQKGPPGLSCRESKLNSGHGIAFSGRRASACSTARAAACAAGADGCQPCDRGFELCLADRQAGLLVQGRPEAGARGLQVRRRSSPGPVPRQRPALHHPPHRGGRPVCRLEAGRAGHHGRADARHHRRPGCHQGRADREIRCPHGRPGGRADQAGQAAVQHARRKPGRELPQDAAGDGARRAGHPDQAGRPPAQHAHHAGHGGRQAHAHRPRDAGHLRAHRAPPGPEPDVPRTAGAVFRTAAPLASCGSGQGRAACPRAPARHRRAGAEGSRKGLQPAQDQGRRQRP